MSLPEVLVALVLLGLGITAMIASVRGVINASAVSDRQAKVDSVLTSASDRLTAWDYVACPGSDGAGYLPVVQAAAGTVGWDGAQVAIDRVEFWDPTAGGAAAAADPIESEGAWVTVNTLTDCSEDAGLSTSRALQRVTIRVTAPNAGMTRTLEVVKSDVVAMPVEEGA